MPVNEALGAEMGLALLTGPHAAMDVIITIPSHFKIADVARIESSCHLVSHIIDPPLDVLQIW